MRGLEGLLSEPMMAAAGWTLLHFLWQGALVAALVGVARSALRNASAQSRYLVGCAALLVLLVLPAITFTWLASADEPGMLVAEDTGEHLHGIEAARHSSSSGVATGVVVSSAMPGALGGAAAEPIRFERWRESVQALLQPSLPWLVLGWVGGVLLLSLRLIGGWTVARRLRTTRTGPVAKEWEERLLRLRQRLRVTRPVLLLESACVAVPTVIGCLRPAILLPLSALTGLSREGLEAVLAHELAHIRRHDFLVNLIQSMIETLLFYHPAVWWISSWVRIERENCCDDLAIEVCGNPLCYAHALTDLETWRSTPRRLVVAADGGVLLARIRRLLGVPSPDAYPSSWPLAGALVLVSLCALGLGVAGGSRTEATAGETQPKTQEILPGADSEGMIPGWCAIRKGGRLLEIDKGRAVRIDGVGRIKLDTKQRLIVFPKDHHLTINGKPCAEGTVVQDGDILRSSDSKQETFWELRLNPDPEGVKSVAGTPEPNLVGEFGLELEWPTRIDLAFGEPYGAFFRSVPVKAQVVLGVIFEPVEPSLAKRIGVEPEQASMIGHVVEGLPACSAGLKAGDVIVDIDGRPPGSQERINRELLRRAAGDPLILGVMRDGEHLDLTALVGARERYAAALEAADAEYERTKPPADK